MFKTNYHSVLCFFRDKVSFLCDIVFSFVRFIYDLYKCVYRLQKMTTLKFNSHYTNVVYHMLEFYSIGQVQNEMQNNRKTVVSKLDVYVVHVSVFVNTLLARYGIIVSLQ